MNGILMTCLAIGTAVAAWGLYSLQMRLERWDYNRHAED